MGTDAAAIDFNERTAKEFRAACMQALTKGDETFIFQGHEILTDYAKYVDEHLTNQGLLPKEEKAA